jgi:hypothetical protein
MTRQDRHAIAPRDGAIFDEGARREFRSSIIIDSDSETRWLREFREQGMPGLFPATQYPRNPYTPERVIVQLIFFKRCAPKAGDRELARVIHHLTGHQLHNHTVQN